MDLHTHTYTYTPAYMSLYLCTCNHRPFEATQCLIPACTAFQMLRVSVGVCGFGPKP